MAQSNVMPSRSPALAGLATIALLGASASARQQPSFRSTADVIAVDVQVIDRNGTPIGPLGADRFDVEIGGQKRRVVSVDYIEHADRHQVLTQRPQSPIETSQPSAPPRVYVIGIDVASFNVAESRAMIEGAREFISRLQPQDLVGLYAFPIGPKFRPSVDHAGIVGKLESIVGSRDALHNSHGLSAMDVIDIMAETAKADTSPIFQPPPTGRGAQVAPTTNSETLDEIVARECGAEDRPCAQAILAEAQGLSFVMQGQATETLNGLRQLVRALGTIDGRKTLIVLSGGMPVSDRPGGRPDVGQLPRQLGQEAASTNTTIYALFLETGFAQRVSAKSQRPDRSGSEGTRQHEVLGRVMDEFTGGSGGALLPVAQGTGSGQFERILRETSSHYLLGVAPAAADRDGTVRRLRVKVKGLERGATIRSRLWVVVTRR